MILFWIICALMVIVALAFILPTLLEGKAESSEAARAQANIAVYRDQLTELETDLKNGLVAPEQYQQDRDEIERRMLEDVAASPESPVSTKHAKRQVQRRADVYAVAFGIPLVAVALYLQLGNRNAILGIATSAPTAPMMRSDDAVLPANDQQRIEGNVAALAKKMEENPNDAQGWMMLANSYTTLGKYPEAVAAYEKAVALKGNDAGLLADYAFALAMKNDRKLSGQPEELLQKALKLDPENPKALQLAGSAAFEAQNYNKAIEYWQKLLQLTGSDPELRDAVSQRIAEAKKLSNKK